MTDIWLAVAVVLGVALALGSTLGRIAIRNIGRWATGLFALTLMTMVLTLLMTWGRLYWARWLPVSAAIIYTNVAVYFGAAAAGLSLGLEKIPLTRRVGTCVLLCLVVVLMSTWPLVSIVIRPPMPGQDVWNGPVAMQTGPTTCSPAAAATLFAAEGIRTSEKEMVSLCLTDRSGTPTLGMYRGVKLMAKRHGKSVEILPPTVPQLLSQNDWPVYLAVRLPYGIEDRRYKDEWGWIPGQGHSVVMLGTDGPDFAIIGDPSIGPERWSIDDLHVLWQGEGMRVK
ncbi:MAG: peptidase C39 [Planctomycetota bacterium]